MRKNRRNMLLGTAAIGFILVALVLVTTYNTGLVTILNPRNVDVVWKDSTGTQVDISTTPLVNGQTYSVAVSATPSMFEDEQKKFWMAGTVRVEIKNATTLNTISTFSWGLPSSFKDTDAIGNTVLTGTLMVTINVIIPSSPGSYKAIVSVMYYLCTATIPYEPGKIPVCTYTIDFGTPNSAGWQYIYGKPLEAKIEAFVWKDASGNVIPDITTATISGTVTCEVTLGVTTYTDSAGTWNFDKTFVNVHQKAGDSYSTTVYKQYTGNKISSTYVITIDTTKIPNGQYKFVLGTSWTGSAGSRVATLSMFYTSFEDGEGKSSTPVEEGFILYVLAVIGIVALASTYFLRRKGGR